MQTLNLDEKEIKKINATLYKFIWNRHYLASKAPERIKREIVNKPIKCGGFGMLDIAELDASLKLRALGRLITSEHPFMQLIKSKVNLTNYFNPKCEIEVEGVVTKGIDLLKLDRGRLWERPELNSNLALLLTISNMNLIDILTKQGKNSLVYFMLSRQVTRVGELQQHQLNQVRKYIDTKKIEKIELAINANLLGRRREELGSSYYCKGVNKQLERLTSKEIRVERTREIPICSYKLGLSLTGMEASTWCYRLSKLTSVRHKTSLLRIAHGDVYTKERLKRFGLTPVDTCPRCDQVETLTHKIYECNYTSRIWQELARLTGQDLSQEPTKAIMGACPDENPAYMTIKAELLGRILQLREEQNYLIHPKRFVKLAIESVGKKELNEELKTEINDLLL